jgi:UDP-glucose 4-epimerase
MQVYGNDYPTRDGSCVRDYIHVSDIAHAHTLALDYLIAEKNKTNCEIFNLGTGNGYTVLEVIHTFEKVSGQKLNYTITGRRAGDIIGIYANNEKARQVLGWTPAYNLEDMMLTAWNWEIKLANNTSK